MTEQLLTLAEVADRLSVGKTWLYQRTKKNEIPVIRVGRFCRFRWSEILDWLETQQNTGEKNEKNS